MKDFRELKVWHKSHGIALEVYKLTYRFPNDEKFGLISQIRRAAVSIPTNIAEGCGRNSNPDLARFLAIAYGSANEVDYLLLLSKDLSIINDPDYQAMNSQIVEVKKMLAALLRKIRE
jgi:four helix bundle protein